MTKPASKDKFRIAVKTALIHSGQSISDLAKTIGRPRPTVSAAINKGRFPKVRAQISAALHGTPQVQPRTNGTNRSPDFAKS